MKSELNSLKDSVEWECEHYILETQEQKPSKKHQGICAVGAECG